MRRWTGCVRAVAILGVTACEIFTEPLGDLQVRLVAGADTLIPGDTVPIRIVAHNAGVFPVGVNGSPACVLGYDVILPDGTRRPRSGSFCLDIEVTHTLAPGDSMFIERMFSGVESPAGPYRLRPYIQTRSDEREGPAVRVEVLPSARARLVHTHPDLPTLDLAVGGRRTATVVARGSPSASGLVPTGLQTVEIRRTGRATPLASAQFAFEEGGRYTFVILAGSSGPTLWSITDPDTVVGPDRGRLRLVHLATQAPAVTVEGTGPDGADPLGATGPLRYGVAWPYVESDPGWWRLLVTRAEVPDTLIQWALRVRGGQVRTLLLIDGAPGRIYGLLLDP